MTTRAEAIRACRSEISLLTEEARTRNAELRRQIRTLAWKDLESLSSIRKALRANPSMEESEKLHVALKALRRPETGAERDGLRGDLRDGRQDRRELYLTLAIFRGRPRASIERSSLTEYTRYTLQVGILSNLERLQPGAWTKETIKGWLEGGESLPWPVAAE